MNEEDRLRWDNKYGKKEPSPEIRGDPFLASNLPGIAPGRALDIACGFGDNAILMAQKGFHVTAIDISSVAVEQAIHRTRNHGVEVDFQVADVEDFNFGDRRYDLITGFYFLNRKIFEAIKRGLKPRGIFLYKTYTEDERRYRPDFNRDYLLAKGELKDCFQDFQILLYEEIDNGKECNAKIIVQRP